MSRNWLNFYTRSEFKCFHSSFAFRLFQFMSCCIFPQWFRLRFSEFQTVEFSKIFSKCHAETKSHVQFIKETKSRKRGITTHPHRVKMTAARSQSSHTNFFMTNKMVNVYLRRHETKSETKQISADDCCKLSGKCWRRFGSRLRNFFSISCFI